nr:hypothetical protein [Tanacetum cinerariifolium]
MDLLSFIRTADPAKVRIGESQCDEDEPKLLETTVGRVVPLLPVTLDLADVGEPSHPAKNLRDDYEAPGGPIVGGKSQSSIQRLLTGAVQNAKVGGGIMPTLPFVSSSVSTTPKRNDGDHIEIIAGANLCAIGAPQRFVISSDSSDHSGVNIAEAEVNSVVRTSMPINTSATTTTTPTANRATIAKEKLVGSSVFDADSPSTGGSHPISGAFSIVLVLKARDEEIENLKARLLLKEAKATKDIRLHAKTFKLEAAEKSLRDEVTALNKRNTILEKERNTLDDAQLKVINDKFDKLHADFVEVTLHLEERFYPHLLTTIAGRRWLLTHGIELAIAKCLNYPEYLSAIGTAVSKAIEKGMQDGLAVGITHGMKGRVLIDIAAHNPTAVADYISALQQLHSVNFPFLAELKANKDASIEAVMNILRLKEHLAARLGLNKSQPHADQLMVPIHHSLDKTVVGGFALSLALDVSNARTSGAAPSTANLTITLFITLASAKTVTPLSVDDY